MRPSFYERRIFPWINDKAGSAPEIVRLRREVLATAAGRVIEIGFGTGASLEHFPPAVTTVTAVEPNEGMNDRAAARIRASRIPVTRVTGRAEQLPFDAGTFDTAVSTLVLCSVTDPHQALSELRRVLRSDGRLLLIEHGLADDPGVARWQHRLNRIQNVVACGCNLNRPTAAEVRRAGFSFETIRESFVPGIPRTHGWVTAGIARPTGP